MQNKSLGIKEKRVLYKMNKEHLFLFFLTEGYTRQGVGGDVMRIALHLHAQGKGPFQKFSI